MRLQMLGCRIETFFLLRNWREWNGMGWREMKWSARIALRLDLELDANEGMCVCLWVGELNRGHSPFSPSFLSYRRNHWPWDELILDADQGGLTTLVLWTIRPTFCYIWYQKREENLGQESDGDKKLSWQEKKPRERYFKLESSEPFRVRLQVSLIPAFMPVIDVWRT